MLGGILGMSNDNGLIHLNKRISLDLQQITIRAAQDLRSIPLPRK